MKDIFEMITVSNVGEKSQAGISIGINVKIGGKETICPISGVCESFEGLETEVGEIYKNLEKIMERAKNIFNSSSPQAAFEMNPDLKPEELWEILASIADEKIFVDTFNKLEQAKRKEVAEYVLTRCNIFSGKGAVFSSQYNNETGLLEI